MVGSDGVIDSTEVGTPAAAPGAREHALPTDASHAQQSTRRGGQTADERPRAAIDRRPVQAVFSVIFCGIGAVLGARLAEWYNGLLEARALLDSGSQQALLNTVALVIVGGLLGFWVASYAFRKIVEFVPRVEHMPVEDKLAGILGVILGLVIAVLLSQPIREVPRIGGLLVALVYVVSVAFLVLVMVTMKKELMAMIGSNTEADDAARAELRRARPKLLDTNVIIDGRILDVWNSRFIEGELLVPQFVLDELQLIADSADELRRARGRRGLDLLNKIKSEVPNFRVLPPRDYEVSVDDVDGVDGKLIRLASHMDASLLTNDSNLERVAELQGIAVLNVNRLVLALRPVVMAGEEMQVEIIREGRDPGQGVAYLDDGTMVVVEDGAARIGDVVTVVVNQMLQTVAGKMIFARLRSSSHNGRHR